ncbi:MAG: beta-galactosidase trimerization domain-containing protein [Planctomycetota bacterium]|nr:beta-galactosidase trimerization domain-containing protein [Planctomycetota bacterium]
MNFRQAGSTPWLETRIRETLRGGTLLTFDYALSKSSFFPVHYSKYETSPPLYCPGVKGFRKSSSHFFDLCQENPVGREIYLNQIRWSSIPGRQYPIFLYELINEVSYICPCVQNVRLFQNQMAKKYGTVQKGNLAWRTNYKSFQEVIPPLNIDSSGIYNSKWGTIPYGDELSVPLWIDWMKVMENRAMEVFGDLKDEHRKIVPEALQTFQTPYWSGTHAQSPERFIEVEDCYGAEHGLSLFRQSSGNEDWNQIKHMVGSQLPNDLVRSASTGKPSINLECRVTGYPHDKVSTANNYIIGPFGLRTFPSFQLVHGVSGSVISYFYDNEISEGGGSVWDHRWMTPEAIKEIPRLKNEILSVADIVLPRPRIQGKIAVVYPRESARIIRPEQNNIHDQFVPEILDYYAATVLTRVPTDVLLFKQILEGIHSKYSMLVLAHCMRAPAAVIEKLREYVESGGVLVLSPDSLLVDDDFGERIDTLKLLGGRVGKEVFKEENVNLEAIGRASGKTIGLRATPTADFKFTFPIYGYEFQLDGAEVIGKTEAGDPTLAVNTIGKGKVYYLAREFEPEARRACIHWIIKRHGILPDLEVEFLDGIDGDYVETHLFQQGQRTVLYALNFGGGPRKVLLKPAKGLPTIDDRVFLRNIHTGENIGPDGMVGRIAWSLSDLVRGITLDLPMHDPVVLLMENASLEELKLRQFTAEQERVLPWLYRPSPKSSSKVLVDGVYVAEGRVHKWRMPTAVKLLEDNGYQVDSLSAPLRTPMMRSIDGVKPDELASYDVFVLSGTHGRNEWEEADIKAVHDYVRNGGGLLYCLIRDWHFPKPQKVLDAMGIQPVYSYFHDPKHHILKEPLYVTFTDMLDHPITSGVQVFQSTGAMPLQIMNKNAEALIRGSDSSYAWHSWGESIRKPGLPVMAALEYGKGRVAVIGTDTWLMPDTLEMGDNQRLFLNTINWLSRSDRKAAASKNSSLKEAPDSYPALNSPEEAVRLWTFEKGLDGWKSAQLSKESSPTGASSIKADKAKGSWYDVAASTIWDKAGLLDLPANPHINLAFRCSTGTNVQVRVEIGKESPRTLVSAPKNQWSYVSLPLNKFERAQGDQSGRRLMEIQIVAGELGDGVEMLLDDISISSGPIPTPRKKQ